MAVGWTGEGVLEGDWVYVGVKFGAEIGRTSAVLAQAPRMNTMNVKMINRRIFIYSFE